jgi:DNA polymerase zeta
MQDDNYIYLMHPLHLTVPTEDEKVPNPDSDEVTAIFYAYRVSGTDFIQSGTYVVEGVQLHPKRLGQPNVESFPTELELLNQVVDLVLELDPDILTGWEVQNNSWGYIQARGGILGDNLLENLTECDLIFS